MRRKLRSILLWALLASIALLGRVDAQVVGPAGPAPVFFTGSPGNPTGTTSTAARVMMGLGSTCTITPKATGTVLFQIYGAVSNSAAGDGMFMIAATGTGTAPVNGAVIVGSGVGNSFAANSAAASAATGFLLGGVQSGLAVGTAVWFDVQLAALTAGTATLSNLTCTAIELH